MKLSLNCRIQIFNLNPSQYKRESSIQISSQLFKRFRIVRDQTNKQTDGYRNALLLLNGPCIKFEVEHMSYN